MLKSHLCDPAASLICFLFDRLWLHADTPHGKVLPIPKQLRILVLAGKKWIRVPDDTNAKRCTYL